MGREEEGAVLAGPAFTPFLIFQGLREGGQKPVDAHLSTAHPSSWAARAPATASFL